MLVAKHSAVLARSAALVAAVLLMTALVTATNAAVNAHAARAAHAAVNAPAARAAYAQQCREHHSARRDRSNPLDLPTAPGANPLGGARFFIPGPAHGYAASAIARLVGLDPTTLPDSESWARFQRTLTSGRIGAELAGNPSLAHQVAMLSKIASQPEVQRFSSNAWGGGPGAAFKQAEKVFCRNMTADRGSIPIINTDFLHATLGGCPTPAQVLVYNPVFHRRVEETAAATGRRPAVYLLELDALGSSACVVRQGSLPEWEADLRYEIDKISSLPHTVVYVEGGYSDSNTVRYTARVLNAIGVRRIRGFFTNDTHQQWTIKEVRWATRISKLTHGAHFIVNTAQNGRGPLLNPHPRTEGIEDLCNPGGRGLGIRDTTRTGYPRADAFMWTHPPGNSSGCGGGPAAGVFWPALAIQMAENANSRLGAGFPSAPY
jgi:endoglucanase